MNIWDMPNRGSDMTLEHSPFADLTGLRRLSQGNHYSHFYEGPEDLTEAVVPFIVAGIRNNEQCLWVTSDPFHTDDAVAALSKPVPDLDWRMASGQVQIISHEDWYVAAGDFCPRTVIQGWLGRERAALDLGYSGLRITGNTFWLDTPQDFEDFEDYEARLHEALKGRRITCLCSYCINKGTGKNILDVVRNHDFAMIRRKGQWEIIESASLKIAKNELQERLAQKERLLTEIHHRVKNNLQIVSSLLMLKADEFGPAAQQALEDTLSRISAMGLVHQMLYEQDCGGLVDLPLYLNRLTQQLSVAYDCQGRISITVEAVSQCVPMLDLDKAIPLGIAITEAITNAIKHAFPDGTNGCIAVNVAGTSSEVQVIVRDNGKGGEMQGKPGNSGAGLALIRGLAKQTGGHADIVTGQGCTLTLTVPL